MARNLEDFIIAQNMLQMAECEVFLL